MARYVEAYVWCIKTQSEAKVDHRETKARQSQTISWYLLHWTGDEEFKHTMKNLVESWTFRCKQQCFVKHPWRNLQQYWERQDQICLYCRCRRIYENTIGTAKVSGRSHRCKMNKFTESLPLGTQVFSDVSSVKNTGCKGSTGKRMGKTWENTGMAADKQLTKSETRKKWSMKQGTRVEKFILHHWWISVISRISELALQ